MKTALTWSVRFFLAFLWASLVAVGQYLIWQEMNQGVSFAGSAGRIGGYAYSAFQRDQNPAQGQYPSRQQVEADLNLLALTTDRVRTYGVRDVPFIAELAEKRGLSVTAGAWISGNEIEDLREIDALIALANKHRNINRVIVGNESLLHGYLPAQRLAGYLDRVRRALRRANIAVSTAEPWHVWQKNPQLAKHVDFITVHLLPYHEGIPIDGALDYVFMRYDELARMFSRKKIVVGEIGWPSKGPDALSINSAQRTRAQASLENEARFIREFLAHPRSAKIDYFLMEAFDQPWKIHSEGWAGAYWGVFNADRLQKFPLDGLVSPDIHWQQKALWSAATAFLPMLLIAFFLHGWWLPGRLWLMALVQGCAATLIIGLTVPEDYYLNQGDLFGLGLLIGATLITIAVLLSHGFEFGELMFKRQWNRRFTPLPPHPADKAPFVSVHLACCNEPPEMVIATLDSLAKMDYPHFEVLVLDNNTSDPALWRPLAAHCARLGSRFRFFHLENWQGFKAGALNYGLLQTDPRAEVVGVVDADYVVSPQWLSCLVPHFDVPGVAVVQAPQAHRDWENQPFRRMCNWEFDGFFRIGMHHRNERNALIQHGTMTLVQRQALEEVGGWSEWCICEDTELGLRLIERRYETRYVDHVLGRGLTPADFAAIKSQRFRWAFGAMQILKAHLPQMLGKGQLDFAQRYHFLTGWFAWFGDALQLVFALASIYWTVGMLLVPQAFGLPVAALALPVLGFMIAKAALGPVLYRRTMNAPWRDILGASVLSVGLAHAIARGVFAGLVRRHGTFVRTPKGWKSQGGWAFIAPIREEVLMLSGLVGGAFALVYLRGSTDIEAVLWIGILALQCVPYFASVLCQIAAALPERVVAPAPDGDAAECSGAQRAVR